MLQSLYDYFMGLFSVTNGSQLYTFLTATQISLFGQTFTFKVYLSILCSFVSLTFIIVLCCLFVKKMVNVVGNLIR